MKCPVCYKNYEPSMPQGEGDKVEREQWISGICSQECWDNLFPADVCEKDEVRDNDLHNSGYEEETE